MNENEHPRLTKRLVTYETPAIVDRLRAQAEAHGTSLGGEVRRLVRVGLAEAEPERDER